MTWTRRSRCLRSTRRTLLEKALVKVPNHAVGGGSLPAASPQRSPKQAVSMHETARNEDIRAQEATRLDQSASQQEASIKALREKNHKLIQLTDGIANMAAGKVGSCLQERIMENQTMRSRLVDSIKETQSQIEQTKGAMSGTRAELKALEDPIRLCTNCNTARKTRATSEHIQDPVSSTLQEHENLLFRSNEQLRRHHQTEKAALQELQHRMSQLQEDLKDKTAALRIDVACVTQDSVQYQFSSRPKSQGSRVGSATMPKVGGADMTAFVPSYNFTSTAPVPLTAR